ncbi:hypothetical protein A2U01_0033842 [Trifolium medium]|uniref:Uncharacterized protein n=1 Tax=Trifolium medium TaxID=97028 RepID=A0A392PPA1_9FABA|nr:hypothetical protein [Trifolium medium]
MSPTTTHFDNQPNINPLPQQNFDNQQNFDPNSTAFQEFLNSVDDSMLTPLINAASSSFPTPGSVENEEREEHNEDNQNDEQELPRDNRNPDEPRRGSRICQPPPCDTGCAAK